MKFRRLSSDLPGERDGRSCQKCGAKVMLERWEECDDNDQPEGIFVTLCSSCARTIVGPHARLYRKAPSTGAVALSPALIPPQAKQKREIGVPVYYGTVFLILLWLTTRSNMGFGFSIFVSAFIAFMGGMLLLAAGAWISEQLFGSHESWPRLIVGMVLAIVALFIAARLMPPGCAGAQEDYDPSDYYHRR